MKGNISICEHDGFTFTIRGLCAKCAPELHKEWHDEEKLFALLEDEFQQLTGKRALQAWDEFERFLKRRQSGEEEKDKLK